MWNLFPHLVLRPRVYHRRILHQMYRFSSPFDPEPMHATVDLVRPHLPFSKVFSDTIYRVLVSELNMFDATLKPSYIV